VLCYLFWFLCYRLVLQEFCSGYKYHSFVDLGLLDENDVLYLFFCVKFHEELNPKHGLSTLELKREKKKSQQTRQALLLLQGFPGVFLLCMSIFIYFLIFFLHRF